MGHCVICDEYDVELVYVCKTCAFKAAEEFVSIDEEEGEV